MNNLLKAALTERDVLMYDQENLLEAIGDKNLPEDVRFSAELRYELNEQSLNMVDGIISRQLELIPIAEFLNDIDNNLSTTCNN